MTCHLTHQRALGSVPISSTAKKHDQLIAGQFTGGFQGVLQGIVSVSVIHEYREGLSLINPLKTPRPSAAATAARMFSRLARPNSGDSISSLPSGVERIARIPSGPKLECLVFTWASDAIP